MFRFRSEITLFIKISTGCPRKKAIGQFSSITNRIWATVLKGTPLRLAGFHPRTAINLIDKHLRILLQRPAQLHDPVHDPVFVDIDFE